MYVKCLWVVVCLCVCMCACVCVHACVSVLCLFTCVCAWDKGKTKKKGEKEGKVKLERNPDYGFEPVASCLWGNCAKLCTTTKC